MDYPLQGSSHPPVLVQDPELLENSQYNSRATPSAAGRRPFRAITHLAVLAAFILPITVLPCLLTRRQLSSIRRKVDEAGACLRVLEQDLNRASSEISTRKDEHRRLRALLHDMMQETDELRLRAEQKEADQARLNDTVRSDLRKLLDETQHTRTQAAALRALGTSLADVAAFMHEVELEMGMPTQGRDQGGVDRLRLLALRMQSLPHQNKVSGERHAEQEGNK